MRLQTQFDIFAFYDRVKQEGMPVAWCSAFAPAEVLLAAGIMPVYPENHAAMLGALSPTRNHDQPYSLPAIVKATDYGLKAPRVCSYALSDIGVLLGDVDSPIHGLPEPSLFYACNSQCNVVERWGDEVQSIYRERGEDVPHYVLRTTRLTNRDGHTPEEQEAFKAQLVEHVDDICARFGTTYDDARLKEVISESNRANKLWQQCLELARQVPAPWSNLDAFTAMAPIVIARGLPECTAYYQQLFDELTQRVANNVAVVPDEQIRLVWDAIPIWPRKNWLAKLCAEHNAVFVASTYTHSWWFDFDERRGLDGIVERYIWNTMNRSTQWILDWTLDLVKDYQADGIVCHWNQSCGIWNSYVKRRLPGYKEANVPHIILEADMVDARAFDEKTITDQLVSFFDELRAAKAI